MFLSGFQPPIYVSFYCDSKSWNLSIIKSTPIFKYFHVCKFLQNRLVEGFMLLQLPFTRDVNPYPKLT